MFPPHSCAGGSQRHDRALTLDRTWAGWLATDHLHPEWQVWPQFINEGFENALKLDGLRSSHPIQVPVRDALDVNQIFDHISYLKGCSVIRMLANHLGVSTFLKGVSIVSPLRTKLISDSLSVSCNERFQAAARPLTLSSI